MYNWSLRKARKKKCGRSNIWNDTDNNLFPKLREDTKSQIQEEIWTPSRVTTNHFWHIIIKFLKEKDKEKKANRSQRIKHITLKEETIRKITNLKETVENCNRMTILKSRKEDDNLKFYSLENHLSTAPVKYRHFQTRKHWHNLMHCQ